MIFPATCKILESCAVLNCNHNTPALGQVSLEHIQKVLIRVLSADISLSVLKNTDQKDKVIVTVQIRFDVPEIADMNCHVITVPVFPRINFTAFSGQINTCHLCSLM